MLDNEKEPTQSVDLNFALLSALIPHSKEHQGSTLGGANKPSTDNTEPSLSSINIYTKRPSDFMATFFLASFSAGSLGEEE